MFQNRVNRNNPVLIPYNYYETCKKSPSEDGIYENGFIVLINPDDYFGKPSFKNEMKEKGLEIGKNALLFYYSRKQWNDYSPESKQLVPATSRKNPLGGHYVARVPATTSSGDEKIRHGYNTSKLKGAGIRVYEYASSETIKHCQLQLEYLFWKCKDSNHVAETYGMTKEDIELRQEFIFGMAEKLEFCLLYTSPSPRDRQKSRMPSSA